MFQKAVWWPFCLGLNVLTHWGRVMHIFIDNLTIIGPDNGLSLGRRQAIIWTNAGILLIGPWGTNFSEILIGIQTCSFKKMHLKMASAKWRPFCLGPNVLRYICKTVNRWMPETHMWVHISINAMYYSGLGSIPFFQFNSNSNSFTFNSNSNSNSFGMKNSNSNSNSNSFLSIPIPIPIPFYQVLFNSFLNPN